MGRWDTELITKGKVINNCRCGEKPQPYKVLNTSKGKTVGFLMRCIYPGCNRHTSTKITLDDAINAWNREEVAD